MHYQVREMQPNDVELIPQIQARLYLVNMSTLLENADLFLNRLALYPDTSFVAYVENELLGCLLAYPGAQHAPPELNVALPNLLQDANNWFLHKCFTSPEARGMGIGHALCKVGTACAVNKDLHHSSLVYWATAKTYWLRYEYTITAAEGNSVLTTKLVRYGLGACFMTQQLSPF